MTTYRVGEAGASVFDENGHLLARLQPGAVVVPGTYDETVKPRSPDQEHPTRRGYDDKVIRPERGPTS